MDTKKQETHMLRSSDISKSLKNELQGFKIGWDAGIQEKLQWLINWPN